MILFMSNQRKRQIDMLKVPALIEALDTIVVMDSLLPVVTCRPMLKWVENMSITFGIHLLQSKIQASLSL